MPGSHIAQTSFFPLGAAAVCSLLLLGWLAPALPGCAAVDPGAGFGNAADGGMAADGAGPPDGGGGGAGGGEDGEDGEDGGGTGARDDAGGLRPADGGCPGAEPACALATGVCLGARRTCRAGVWQPCTIADYTAHHPAYSEQETAALCDELDNDCDGRTDEACSCRPGEVRACGTDEGECQAGSERCAGGRWGGACEGAVNPAAEGCNGLDDDCDGQTDEGCACRDGEERACGSDEGECRAGLQRCAGGRWDGACAGAVGPQAEGCNGQDDDCDGQTDEGCACQDGASRPCGSDEGECRRGAESCARGQWTGVCMGETGPAFEGCDGLDNDCDGQTDEGCECQPGMTRACGSDEGECRRGTQRCVRGAWDGCDGVGPEGEECNGRDDDCDGATDEGNLCPADHECKAGGCSRVRWVFEAESGAAGHAIGRRDAEGWSVSTQLDDDGVMLFGPYTRDIPVGSFTALYRMQIDVNDSGNDDVVRLEVNDFDGRVPDCGNCVIASRTVRRREFAAPRRYQEMPLAFVNRFANHRLEFRIYWHGTAYILVDKVTVVPSF